MKNEIADTASPSLDSQIEACRADARSMFATEMWCEKDDFLFRISGGRTLRVRNDGVLSWEIVAIGDSGHGVVSLPPVGMKVNAFWD